MTLDNDQRIILETISTHDGEWNWYKVGRRCIGLVGKPGNLTLAPFLKAGLIVERKIENEPLPRLFMTETGKAALEAHHAD